MDRDWNRKKCIVCKAVTPPDAKYEGADPFEFKAKGMIKLIVPEISVEAYREHWVWRQFNVVGDPNLNPVEVDPEDPTEGPTSSIEQEASSLRMHVDGKNVVLDTEADVELFSLSGVRLYNGRTASLSIPTPGIYLITADGNTRKVQIL